MREVITDGLNYLSMDELLAMIPGDNGRACERIYADHGDHFRRVRGSSHNHQAWPGGYLDHVVETMNIARLLYGAMSAVRLLPFGLDDALLVLFLHDIEKPWKYEVGEDGTHHLKWSLRHKEAQEAFRLQRLAEYGITLTPEQQNAMEFVEGEYREYSNKRRVSGPLAAFCHLCDVTSARIWFDFPAPEDDPWQGASRAAGQAG
jgi:hypothetical protein